MKQKEYKKLTVEQFTDLIHKLPEVRKECKSLNEVVKLAPKGRIDEIFEKDFYWSKIYECTFAESLAYLILALDKLEFLQATVMHSDPQQYFMDNFEIDIDPENYTGGWQGAFKKQDLIGLVVALQKNILSIFIYQKTLHTLVEEATQGIDKSLFDAVRIDRSIVACPPIAGRISKAEIRQDRDFFIHLRSALKGPSKRHWESYQDLRYALCVLRELGFDKLTDEQLEILLVHQLKVYPNNYSARKNLRKQYDLSKKINHLK